MTNLVRVLVSLVLLFLTTGVFASVVDPRSSDNQLQIVQAEQPAVPEISPFSLPNDYSLPTSAFQLDLIVKPHSDGTVSFQFEPIIGISLAGTRSFDEEFGLRTGGLYYFNARFYDPTLGRFITEDPARSGSNWYEYGNDNPLRYTDPTGLNPQTGGVWDLVNGAKNILGKVSSFAWNAQSSSNNPVGWIGSGALGFASTTVNAMIPENQDEAALMFVTADTGVLATNAFKGALALKKELSKISEKVEKAAGDTEKAVGVGRKTASDSRPVVKVDQKDLEKEAADHDKQVNSLPATTAQPTKPTGLKPPAEQTPPTLLGKVVKALGKILDLTGKFSDVFTHHN